MMLRAVVRELIEELMRELIEELMRELIKELIREMRHLAARLILSGSEESSPSKSHAAVNGKSPQLIAIAVIIKKPLWCSS